MKLLLLGGALLFFGGLFAPRHQTPPSYTILISGNADGNLAPCGCTKPMSGGIKRRVAAIRALSGTNKRVLVLENGGLVSGTTRQDEMKAETLAESLKSVGVTAINMTKSEVALGPAMVDSVHRLSGEKLTSASFDPTPTKYVISGPFLIAGVSGGPQVSGVSPAERDTVIESVIGTSKQVDLRTILLLDDSLSVAKEIAQKQPSIYLIVYKSSGAAPAEPTREGSTWLVTPGEKAKQLLQISGTATAPKGYAVVKLGPEVKDDPTASRAYNRYLDRIVREKLFERIPRGPTVGYTGSKACGACHSSAYESWTKTAHSHALKTLENEKHDRDPDCVACHVVGMESIKGFMSRSETPDLADVGCESCHGPGADHADSPTTSKLPKLGEKICTTCHTPDTSPQFDFEKYWAKVIHN
ncbi:MAG: multiheme c-type cytochrome [Fimbriimonadaceae bacterium]